MTKVTDGTIKAWREKTTGDYRVVYEQSSPGYHMGCWGILRCDTLEEAREKARVMNQNNSSGIGHYWAE